MPQYKRCPACGEMNKAEDAHCYACEAEVPDAVPLPVGGAPVQALAWNLSLGSLIQDSVDLYFRTFLRLLVLLIGLTLTSFAYLFLSLVLLMISGWFFLLVAPVGAVLACSFWSSHLCLLVDSVRGQHRSLPGLIGVGFLRGINLALSLVLLAGLLIFVSLAMGATLGPAGILPLYLLLMVLAVWAYPLLPVMVLEGKGPLEAFSRAVELTENFRLNIFFLILMNGALAMLLQIGTLAVLGGADAAMSMYGGEDLAALIPLTVGACLAAMLQVVIWSLSTVLSFVVFWKRTNGDKVALFL